MKYKILAELVNIGGPKKLSSFQKISCGVFHFSRDFNISDIFYKIQN